VQGLDRELKHVKGLMVGHLTMHMCIAIERKPKFQIRATNQHHLTNGATTVIN
jgi:hypothetical protein